MKKIILKDVIAHLQTLPQDMEVWDFWDEGGSYHRLESIRQGHVATIAKMKRYHDRRKTRWMEYGPFDKDEPIIGKPKKVVILQESIDEFFKRTKAKKSKKD
jgi:hypothetical protein